MFPSLQTVEVCLADDASLESSSEDISFECLTNIGIEMGSQTITTVYAELDSRFSSTFEKSFLNENKFITNFHCNLPVFLKKSFFSCQ